MRQEDRTDHAARTTQPSSFVSLLSGWIQQGMESFFATQKILMEVATRQNANTMKAMRESLADPKHSPTSMLKELVIEGTANFVEAQRILLDLGQKENEILLNGVKERVGNSTTASAMTDMVRRSIDTFLDMQQEFLTIASRQAEVLMRPNNDPEKQGYMTHLAKQAMTKFVEAQKQFLDVVAEETERMTGTKPAKAAGKPTELNKVAHESAMAMVEAQKKLLDVAAQQMNVNLQLAGKAAEMSSPLRVPLAKMTGEGVKNFVDAEKALIDSIAKRRMAAEPKSPKTPKPRAKVRRRAKPMAKAAHA